MYADPFAELQGRKADIATPAPSLPVLPLMPSISGTDSSFPVSEEAFPVEGENAPVKEVDALSNTVDSQQVEISSVQPYSTESFHQQATELDLQTHDTYESHYTVKEQAYAYGGETRQEFYEELSQGSHARVQAHPATRVDINEAVVEEVCLPQDETIQMDQRHDEAEIEIENNDNYTSGAHPFEDPAAEFIELLDALGYHSDLSVINRVISHAIALDIAREDPITRTFFCEAIELVTFRTKFSGQLFTDMVNVLLDCLTQACTSPDSDEDRKTAAASLGALWNLTFSEDQPFGVVKLATCARRAMETFAYDNVSLINATGLLVNIVCTKEGRNEFFNLGIHETVIRAISSHHSDSELLGHVCQIFAILSYSDDSRSKVPQESCASIIKASELCDDQSIHPWKGLLKRIQAP
jgi:hypothetical protein